MAPRKKGTTSRKSNQNPQNTQPSKFGIQHFFERHTQNSLSQKIKPAPSPRGSDPIANPKRADNESLNPENEPRSNNVDSVIEKSKNELNVGVTEMATPLEDSPTDCRFLEGDHLSPPEICKSFSIKRFKFSPGMLIKQSQDDGGDEITWKISPVNDRLHAVSKKLPDMVRVLAESSRLSSLNIQHCQLNKDSPESPAKLEEWLSSPPLKPHRKSAALSTRVGLKRVSPCHDIKLCRSQGSLSDKNNSCITNSQSPFKTPPSLSYCPDKPDAKDHTDGKIDQLGSRQHKKALLELLDQVEGVISVDEPDCEGLDILSCKIQNKSGDEKTDSATTRVINDKREKSKMEVPDLPFLVLEVSEKRGAADSTGSQRAYKVLRLLNEQRGEERAVHLWDEWFYSIVAPGDTVNVIGDFDDRGKCDVNRDNRYLIVHPDVLVSGTRVAASFSCPRRTILDERLKSGEQSVPALIGTLLHQIFQAGLIRDTPTQEFLEEYTNTVLQKNMESLYACGVNENEFHKTLIEAIPKMLNWILHFRDSQDSRVPSVDFGSDEGLKNVKITEVTDIEEMAWAPKYGLKGMFDASLRVRYSFGSNEVEERMMPLEFKTGKGTSGQTAMEHRAQVMLYTLLMSERYLKTIDRGILYYLHTNETQGIAIRRSNLIGMIMRRNELANDILKASVTQQLPPMLQSPNMCKGCRHLNVCTIYHKAHGGGKESSGLGDLFDSLVQHLTSGHFTFLRQWERLIDLEAKVTQDSKKDIWCSSSLPFEKSASCLSSVVLDTSEEHSQKKSSKENRFIYRFIRKDLPPLEDDANNEGSSSSSSSPTDDINCVLKSGDYVVLTTESARLMVASGVIVEIRRSHVTVSFSKRLRLPASSPASVTLDLQREVWRIYKDESVTLFAIMRFNLVQLFLESEHSFNLRRMIVDLEAPRFDSGCIFSQDPAISYIWSEKNLNNDQRRAIIKILTAKDYALILGMPGTGKTSTMVHAVKALLMRGASILLTSYTNSAVDNLLIKLKAQGIDFVRIGRKDAVHVDVRGHCFSEMNIQRVDEIKARLDEIKVVAVTCLGITSPLLVNKRFDVCIMDEAGQITLPVSLGPLMYASKFVLVGDHYQLPPLVQSTEALENGMGVSLFCRLSETHPQAISALQSQYRMCAGIMQLSNALIYGNRLCCGSAEVENSKLKFTSSKYTLLWLKEVLDPNKPVIFVNTDMLPALESKDGKTVNNPLEAKIIAQITEELVNKGIEAEDIGVITPYNSQASLIRQAVSTSVEIHTIDKYQGRDKDCILISFVRSTESPRNCISSLLGDWHRINVALTRAKRKMIMVGSCKTLSKVPLLKLLIQKVEEQSEILILSHKDINPRELKRCSHVRRN